jgi:hypothetical protein
MGKKSKAGAGAAVTVDVEPEDVFVDVLMQMVDTLVNVFTASDEDRADPSLRESVAADDVWVERLENAKALIKGAVMSDEARLDFATGWHAAMRDYYSEVKQSDAAERLDRDRSWTASVDAMMKPVGFGIGDIWDELEEDCRLFTVRAYLRTLNTFAAIATAISKPMMKRIKKIIPPATKTMKRAGDIAAATERVFSKVSEEDQVRFNMEKEYLLDAVNIDDDGIEKSGAGGGGMGLKDLVQTLVMGKDIDEDQEVNIPDLTQIAGAASGSK